MKTLENQQFHFGVYGILCVHNKVLVIRKGRGPYTGRFDLPGGRIEFGESVELALRREIEEEVGVHMATSQFASYNEYFCDYTNDNVEDKKFHHVGLYFTVTCDTGEIKTEADGHDSLGAVFVDKDSLTEENCAPIALQMIQKYA